ncbi:hypothetical protein KC342_g91 [Hortaea werneckii]|nr:hypothetical protein KC342_g91 [Hortaea werneckii]
MANILLFFLEKDAGVQDRVKPRLRRPEGQMPNVMWKSENCDEMQVSWSRPESMMPVNFRAGRSTDELVSPDAMRGRLKANCNIAPYLHDLNLAWEPRSTSVFAITTTKAWDERCHASDEIVQEKKT